VGGTSAGALERAVDAGQQVRRRLQRGLAVEQHVAERRLVGPAGAGALVLRAVSAAREAAHLRPGRAEQRVEDAGGDVDGRRRVLRIVPAAGAAAVDGARLPGAQAGRDLVREALRIGGGAERLLRQARDRLVVLSAAREPRAAASASRPGGTRARPRTMSPSVSSRPHFSYDSSTLNEKPNSYARPKYCSTPS
jgi:hypothetical protein